MSQQAASETALATVAREAGVNAVLAAYRANRAASRHLPAAERRAARRASSTAAIAAIDEAHAAFRAAISPSASPSPADLCTHLGVSEVGLTAAVGRLPPELPGLVGALAMRGAVFGAHGAQVMA